ncbi:3-phosphoshikimate 1-carboxyvinyltransferase [archaeon BMS3Bbin16]|nr:3-phosphoshikimate 1-carboxyvinyltransferase [archaeon BMS3Bbin16]
MGVLINIEVKSQAAIIGTIYFNLKTEFALMDVKIKESNIRDFTVMAPASKSYTHRAYALALLADGRSRIHSPLRAGDTDSTLAACQALGAKISIEDRTVVIDGTGGVLETPPAEIDVGNSGTTIRLFTSIAALNGRTSLTGDESIQKRPMQPLLDALSQLGVKAVSTKDNGTPPIEVAGGKIPGGTASIRGDISSQFISSLLIAAPYARKPVEIELTTPLKSRPYVDVTLDIMKGFGLTVETDGHQSFTVPQGVYKHRDYTVEGDYSSASYFLALAAMTDSKATVENLQADTVQGDRNILNILNDMGANIVVSSDSVRVDGGDLSGVEVDLGDTPDLLPTVAALASAAKGETVINNIEHARYKESDRVAACAREFARFGAEIEEGRDYLKVKGGGNLRGARVNSYGDHRMVMALAILGACAEGETVIGGAESVDISFPDFFNSLSQAGVEVSR